MKKRVYWSTLPYEQQMNEIKLNVVVEGRHNIIKYGSLACAHEMRSYYTFVSGSHKDYLKASDMKRQISTAITNRDYEVIIKNSIEGFSDGRGWIPGYGGVVWLKIGRHYII